ncbi:hypothetical protein RRG08_023474 [Elysia crispata]|uniref:Uncharacterized protein n=1 Tax=Elysia crispata TaxID=231223 RepID=A0AAE1ADY0_9GAST|nr:hypothetical protein RRG08_023474 [Elysia crispata]
MMSQELPFVARHHESRRLLLQRLERSKFIDALLRKLVITRPHRDVMSPACMAWTVADNPRLKVKVKWGGGHKRVKNWPKRRRKWKRKRINFHEIRRRESAENDVESCRILFQSRFHGCSLVVSAISIWLRVRPRYNREGDIKR